MPVSCDPLPIKKLPVMLPVADINPAVKIFPPVTLPVAVINVSTVTLPYIRVPELSLAIVLYLPWVIYRNDCEVR